MKGNGRSKGKFEDRTLPRKRIVDISRLLGDHRPGKAELTMSWRLAMSAAFFLISSAISASAEFSDCVAQLKSEAARDGVSSTTLNAAFAGIKPDPKVLEFENFQPEFKTPIWDYMAALVDDERVSDGKAALTENARTFALAERKFGVSRFVIAAIWGVESDFGRAMGDRPLVQSLTTLACSDSRRPKYFRSELMSTLKIADSGDIPLEKLKGSWAGAFGQTQFMPSTFIRLAVDLDGSGRNIIDNPAAAIGSTANYLRKSGWISGDDWGFEVKIPSNYQGSSGRKNRHPMSYWAEHGISRIDGGSLGTGDAGLILPAGVKGPAFLVKRNFDVIYSYNAAESYALAAAILAQRLGGGSGIVTPWPAEDRGLSRAERRELQQLLSQHGYDVGTPDGAIGEKTRKAILDFESKHGLGSDGRASEKVLEALRK